MESYELLLLLVVALVAALPLWKIFNKQNVTDSHPVSPSSTDRFGKAYKMAMEFSDAVTAELYRLERNKKDNEKVALILRNYYNPLFVSNGISRSSLALSNRDAEEPNSLMWTISQLYMNMIDHSFDCYGAAANFSDWIQQRAVEIGPEMLKWTYIASTTEDCKAGPNVPTAICMRAILFVLAGLVLPRADGFVSRPSPLNSASIKAFAEARQLARIIDSMRPTEI